MRVVFDDGGRAAAGFAASTTDCAIRAIVIAAELPYAHVHRQLGELMAAQSLERRRRAGVLQQLPADHPAQRARWVNPDDPGVPVEIMHCYLQSLGWHGIENRLGERGDEWHATLADLPAGRYVLEYRTATKGHAIAFVDGELRDGPVTIGRDFLRQPLFGWWTKDPQMPRRPRNHTESRAQRRDHGKRRKRR